MLSFIWHSIIGRFIILINIIVIAVFVACSLNPLLNLDALLGAGFLGILFPYALGMMLVFFVISLIFKPRWAVVLLLVLALNWKQIFICIVPHIQNPTFSIIKKKGNQTLRIFNWNIRRCLPEHSTNIYDSKFTQEHADLLKIYKPDIVCLQECLINSNKMNDPFQTIHFFLEQGYPYYFFSKDYTIDEAFMSGNIIFSKYKIVNKQVTHFDRIEAGSESMMYADIAISESKVVRVFTTHLESYGFKKEEYQEIKLIRQHNEKSWEASRDIFFKMRNTFLIRKQQADIIKSYLEHTTLPFILCGDFNDVPNSYTYSTLSDNMKDAFVEKGFLLGRTYPHLLPTLRIDYILASKPFKVQQFETIPSTLSDHYPLVADVVLK